METIYKLFDTDSALLRFGEDKSFFIDTLRLFINGDEFNKLLNAFENKDYILAHAETHKIKNSCGMLGFERCYKKAIDIYKLLTNKDYEAASILFNQFKDDYYNTCKLALKYMEDSENG